MSYNLTPIVIDLPKLKSLMGSKDTALLRTLIKKNRKELLDFDAIAGDDEEFEAELEEEYDALVAGDFSAVDLKKVYPVPKDDDDGGEDDEELTELVKGLGKPGAQDPEAKAELMKKLGGMMENLFDDDDEDDEDEPEEEEPSGPGTTAGAALAHLILGGNQDPSCGYKYWYVLEILCKEYGEVPDHDSWTSIRNESFHAVDAVLRKVGAKKFATAEFFINRKPPVGIAEPEDFPFMGYLTRAEIARILSRIPAAKIESALRTEDEENREWLRSCVDEFRTWMEVASQKGRDLIFFYS